MHTQYAQQAGRTAHFPRNEPFDFYWILCGLLVPLTA